MVLRGLGPNGSGKSTLGNILLGLMPFEDGTVERPSNLPAMRYQKIYQDPPSAFIAHQTLGQSFDDLRRLHWIDAARQPAMMESLGLDRGLLAGQPSAISGGELQRFAIARSLLLDPVSQKRVIDLLVAQVRERDLALLLVTHDEALAERIANRIIRVETETIPMRNFEAA
ncbi:ATP-binding cassette domain-containing protein [Thalassospira xiamenensis]|uniref:ATP-binding cassette domain-containing protein n=1 Tax=Thalassospira TaxID=168934 RepID=UPI000A70F43D|nr:ATP-binding cassette domain-containing protein [Thalassospira xiamenensis]